MRLFRPFILETRILTWSEGQVVMEHRMVPQAKDGSPVLNAIAFVRVGLYDRKEKSFVAMDRLPDEIGLQAQTPRPRPKSPPS